MNILNKTYSIPLMTVFSIIIMLAFPMRAHENGDCVDNSDISGNHTAIHTDSRFALKTNLLAYALILPNVEGEWKFADRWSAALEFQGMWIGKKTPHKVYKIAMITPEVRFWAINRARWHGMYVGVFGAPGLYDFHNGRDGHQGEGFMTGLSLGYMWPVGEHLSLEAGIGAGYMRLRDKVYTPLDGHYLYQLTKNINYFGPLRVKLSLVWRIPK